MIASLASPTETYWSDTYRGREIAALQHGQGWLVYVDRTMRPGRMFATAEDAVRWMRQVVDGADLSDRAWLLSSVTRARRRARRTAN